MTEVPSRYLTRRAAHPFWLQVDVPPNTTGKPDLILIRDKYLRQIELWAFAADGRLLAHERADRSAPPSDSSVTPYDDGYAVSTDGVRPARLVRAGTWTYSALWRPTTSRE